MDDVRLSARPSSLPPAAASDNSAANGRMPGGSGPHGSGLGVRSLPSESNTCRAHEATALTSNRVNTD